MTDFAEMVKRTTILRGVVGSTLHGLAVDDGLEDRDEMGVCIEDIQCVVGWERFANKGTYVYRTAEERQKAETGVSSRTHAPRSVAGDLDLVVHSLKKYLQLALNGSPTVLHLLMIPDEFLVCCTATGAQLRELAPKILSRRVGSAFKGYMDQQYKRLIGEAGQKRSTRPELVEKYGYDTKYAMHVLRLGLQGMEFMLTGRLTYPMSYSNREFLIRVRNGEMRIQDVGFFAKQYGEALQTFIEDPKSSPLPAEPDVKAVEDWMTNIYLQRWKARDFDQFLASRRSLSGEMMTHD
jgi:predicted nucleotidyltransferase